MSDDKQLSGMVVCDWISYGHVFPHEQTQRCINPRPASPTPEQPAQDQEIEEKFLPEAPVHYGSQEALAWADGWNACLAEVKRRRALAPPAQTQQGLSEVAGWTNVRDQDGALMLLAPAAVEVLRKAGHWPLNPDKQPSPSAAHAQEPEHVMTAADERTAACGLIGQLLPYLYSSDDSRDGAGKRGLCNCCEFSAVMDEHGQWNCDHTPEDTGCAVQDAERFIREVDAEDIARESPATQPASPEGALREALAELVERLDFVHASDSYRGVWANAQIHGGQYRGPTYVDALAAARAALAGQPAREELDKCACGAMTLGVSWSSVSVMNGDSHARDLCSDCQGKDLPRAAPSTTAQPAREDEPTEDVLVRDADGEVDMIASLRKGLEKRAAEDDQKALRAAARASAAQCKCGQREVPAGADGVQWYWQRHARDACTLQLPNAKCWCGLLRSEHIDGHDETKDRALAGSPAGEGREDNQEQLGKKRGE